MKVILLTFHFYLLYRAFFIYSLNKKLEKENLTLKEYLKKGNIYDWIILGLFLIIITLFIFSFIFSFFSLKDWKVINSFLQILLIHIFSIIFFKYNENKDNKYKLGLIEFNWIELKILMY